jgi:hypothetical protein
LDLFNIKEYSVILYIHYYIVTAFGDEEVSIAVMTLPNYCTLYLTGLYFFITVMFIPFSISCRTNKPSVIGIS